MAGVVVSGVRVPHDAGRWRWPLASHGGGTAGVQARPHRASLPPGADRSAALWPRSAIERAPEVHLHLHGVFAEDIAAVVA